MSILSTFSLRLFSAENMNDELSGSVIGCAYTVYNQLGFGFLESVYEKALSIELKRAGIIHERQSPVQVFYENEVVGDFVVDLLVENKLVVELKAVTHIITTHEIQLVNYLAATRLDVGLLINFGVEKVEVRRKYRTFVKK